MRLAVLGSVGRIGTNCTHAILPFESAHLTKAPATDTDDAEENDNKREPKVTACVPVLVLGFTLPYGPRRGHVFINRVFVAALVLQQSVFPLSTLPGICRETLWAETQ